MPRVPQTKFEKFAHRRSRLAGKALLDDHNPYFQLIDKVSRSGFAEPGTPVTFAHYDYLGLSGHPKVVKAAVDAIELLGPGVGASRLVGGERRIHREFEVELAEFLGFPAALTLVSGYLTNLTLINHIAGRRDLIVADELSHNSIMSALRTQTAGAGAALVFRHNDLDHLDALLEARRSRYSNVFIVVESLYSMDGDVVDLPRLLEIKDRHSAFLMLDEAHAIGVMGETGRGAAEYFGVDPVRIDIITGSLSKALVTAGGFIAANETVISWLRYTLPGFVFSVGAPPSVVASAHAALQILRAEPERVARLAAKSKLFLDLARQRGLNVGAAIGLGVVPILLASQEETIWVSQTLSQAGVYAPPIIHVGVPREAPRIRFFLNADHEDAAIRRTIDLVAEARTAFAEYATLSGPEKALVGPDGPDAK